MCSVIVSQWTSMLQIVAVHLRQMGLKYGVIDGTVNPKRRMDLVEEFNTDSQGIQVKLRLNLVNKIQNWNLLVAHCIYQQHKDLLKC